MNALGSSLEPQYPNWKFLEKFLELSKFLSWVLSNSPSCFLCLCVYMLFLIDFYWVKPSHFTETKIYVKLTLMLQTLHTLLSWYALRYQPTPLKNTAPLFFAKSTLKSVNCPNSPFLGNRHYIKFFLWTPHLKIGFFIGPTVLKFFVLNSIPSLKSS